jgi:hydroxymethylbilane synthase
LQAQRVRIGTRGSPLALAQAHEVRDRLMAAHAMPEEAFEIVVVRTSGDRIQDRPLAEAGGKGLFTKEIEEALLAGSIDLAVHSMKDVPTELPAGLALAAILPRADPRDGFVSLKFPSLTAMPAGARVGTSSLRRGAQVRRLRPDLEVVGFRGNVETRLGKLAAGTADATLLAVAGLVRLGLGDRMRAPVEPTDMLPAVAQGAIGLEIRSNDRAVAALAAPLDDPRSAAEVRTERAFLARLEGSCRTPIAGLARIESGTITFDGEILSFDGRLAHATRRFGPIVDFERMARDAADELRARGGPHFFAGY